MDAPSGTPTKPKSFGMNGGIVKLTPSRAPTAGSQGMGTDLEHFETAHEPDTVPLESSFTTSPQARRQSLRRAADSTYSGFSTLSKNSVPPPGSVLTGKQEHYLKRELISAETEWEITELSHPTALQRFGAPFKSDIGEVAPEDSELPLLRYMFVNHVRNFPFVDQAKEKEFWQDKLQTFLESFANKHISSSEDRLEETKRKKLAVKAQKLVELMMVSGIPTASGYEERIRFSEMEVVDRGANDQGLKINVPQGHEINGWDVNVAGVRIIKVKHHLRHRKHAEFLLRVKRGTDPEIYVARRFGDFTKMHKRLRLELPGKVLAPMPRKNKTHSLYSAAKDDDDDSDSISSVSTQDTAVPPAEAQPTSYTSSLRSYIPGFGGGHRRNQSKQSPVSSPRASIDTSASTLHSRSASVPGSPLPPSPRPHHVLVREEQRVSLRAFLRNALHNEQIAQTQAMTEFLTANPMHPNEEEMEDVKRRMEMDEKRVEEQRQFYEIARQRARELDVHMEKFRREIVESNGLTNLFREIKEKPTIQDLKPEYQKFAEWLRIEVAATIYHLFLAEDNSPELFAQAKRIHSLIPYGALKQVIRFANPAAVMAGVLDLFLAQPFGARSLLQRIFGLALGDGIRSVQKSIDTLITKTQEPVLCEKIHEYVQCSESQKNAIRAEAKADDVDIVVALLKTDQLEPTLEPEDIGRVFNAYVAWNNAVENVDLEMQQGAELFANLKQVLRLYTRQRDKTVMLELIEEPTTLRLFRDLFTIFYEPLVRVYKSANVYSSVTDFAQFADDAIKVVEQCQRQDVSADPNQTVQAFIDLCQRHEHNFYKFVHEVHLHDNGLFDQLMSWIEGILQFLRLGPRSGAKLDMNALFAGAVEMGQVNKAVAVKEINALIRWQEKRKRWHADKTRQKMAITDAQDNSMPGSGAGDLIGGQFKSSDFGIHALDLQELGDDDDQDGDWDDSEDEDEDADPIVAERKRRAKKTELLRRTAGEPIKPQIVEVSKMRDSFVTLLRQVLAE